MIHPTALIDPSAKIHPSAEIGAYAVIGPGTEIRQGTTVGHHAWIEFSNIGPNNKIFPYAVIGAPPQDMRYDFKPTNVIVGENCTIREFSTIHRATNPDVPTKIGDNCYLMASAHVAHDCKVANRVILANGSLLGGHVEVQDGTIISGLVAVHQFVRIGRLAMIGGGAMVSQDIPPFCQAQGDRVKLIGLNIVGLKRNHFSSDVISEIKSAYKSIFVSGLPMQEALDQIAASEPCPAVMELLDFISKSKRGVCHPRYKETFSEDE